MASEDGADDQDRTGDLVLTKDVLCQLSYIGIDGLAPTGALLERETGIEPATNSLEGCDSTIELLPQSLLAHQLPRSRPRLVPPAKWMVAREGFEPSKPLGRQIYSLLRLTASLPRQILIFVPRPAHIQRLARNFPELGAGEGI